MREEIFGPVRRSSNDDDVDDAIGAVNRGDRPLALYWFGRDAARRQRVLRETIAGGVTVNDCLLHFVQEGSRSAASARAASAHITANGASAPSAS